MTSNSSLSFVLKVKEDILNDMLAKSLQSALDGEKYEVNGVILHLKSYGSPTVQIDRDNIRTKVFLDIKLLRPSGVFSVEVEGKLILKLTSRIQIADDYRLETNTEVDGFDWEEEPKFIIGSLDIPIEKLVNLVFKHYNSVITAKIDASIMENVDMETLIKSTLKKTDDFISKYQWHGVRCKPLINKMEVTDASHYEDYVLINGNVKMGVELSDSFIEHNSYPVIKLFPSDEESCDSQFLAKIDIHFKVFELFMAENLKGMDVGGKPLRVNEIKSSFDDHELSFDIRIDQPIQANVLVTGRPLFREDAQVFDLENLDVKVHANNILYKLTAPVVNRLIEKKIGDYLPFDMRASIDKNLSEMQQLMKDSFGETVNINHGDISLKNLTIYENKMSADLIANGVEVDLDIDNTIFT